MTLQQALAKAVQLKQVAGSNLFGHPPMWVTMRKEDSKWYSAIEMPALSLSGDQRAWLSYEDPKEGSKLCSVLLVATEGHTDWEVYDHRVICPGWHDAMDQLIEDAELVKAPGVFQR